ncbi:uncharacterized protein B0P05DRAFT_555123 [Gilbertella persicaria]|uniref:uncharacterized protein n=1 Tax=Gilbertella persicaria TaxID=101096 RepID=UPI00221FC1D0|nr:uncharacterized protein B0P05DRAFT_555123 [Gilbertella persicaria]KAI8063636.1 hypothetical protein B0P05DRAFT_555123 [Gilbertella persicaria]
MHNQLRVLFILCFFFMLRKSSIKSIVSRSFSNKLPEHLSTWSMRLYPSMIILDLYYFDTVNSLHKKNVMA